jgi:hypothetical protein
LTLTASTRPSRHVVGTIVVHVVVVMVVVARDRRRCHCQTALDGRRRPKSQKSAQTRRCGLGSRQESRTSERSLVRLNETLHEYHLFPRGHGHGRNDFPRYRETGPEAANGHLPVVASYMNGSSHVKIPQDLSDRHATVGTRPEVPKHALGVSVLFRVHTRLQKFHVDIGQGIHVRGSVRRVG